MLEMMKRRCFLLFVLVVRTSNGARSTPPGEGVLNKNPSLGLSGKTLHMVSTKPTPFRKGITKWIQDHTKWGLGSILLRGWLPRGLQTPFRIDFDKVLGQVGITFTKYFNCWTYFSWFLYALCSIILQKHVNNTMVHQKHTTDSFHLTLCAI